MCSSCVYDYMSVLFSCKYFIKSLNKMNVFSLLLINSQYIEIKCPSIQKTQHWMWILSRSLIVQREKVFKKNHSCRFILFSKLCYAPIFFIHLFSNNLNHSSLNIFSIYIYTCPVNVQCHFNSTDGFRREI